MVVRSLLPKALGLTKNGAVPGDFNVTLKSVGWARITSPSTQLQVATSIKQRMATYKHHPSFTASLPLKKGGTGRFYFPYWGTGTFQGLDEVQELAILFCIHGCYKSEMFMLLNPEKKQSQVGDMFFWYGSVEFWKTLPSKIVTKSWVYRIAHEKGGFLYKGSISWPFQTSEPSFNISILQNFPWNRNSRKMKPYMKPTTKMRKLDVPAVDMSFHVDLGPSKGLDAGCVSHDEDQHDVALSFFRM